MQWLTERIVNSNLITISQPKQHHWSQYDKLDNSILTRACSSVPYQGWTTLERVSEPVILHPPCWPPISPRELSWRGSIVSNVCDTFAQTPCSCSLHITILVKPEHIWRCLNINSIIINSQPFHGCLVHHFFLQFATLQIDRTHHSCSISEHFKSLEWFIRRWYSLPFGHSRRHLPPKPSECSNP